MDDDQQNSEIEKIANLMIHDDLSVDEHDVGKLEKYKNQIKEDCEVDDDHAMKLGYWGLGGGTRLRKVFSLLANTKRDRYLTSFALRDLIQKKMGSENVEFVAMLDPEHWDYYRVDLLGGIV